MNWPVNQNGGIQSVVLTGDITSARWGTDGLLPGLDVLNASGISVLAITKATQRPKKTDEEYKQGSGVQVGRAQILHGVIWDVTVRDRVGVNFPNIGSAIVICDMANHFGSGIGAHLNGYVFDTPYDANAGAPGERSIVIEKITLIEGTA